MYKEECPGFNRYCWVPISSWEGFTVEEVCELCEGEFYAKNYKHSFESGIRFERGLRDGRNRKSEDIAVIDVQRETSGKLEFHNIPRKTENKSSKRDRIRERRRCRIAMMKLFAERLEDIS